MLSVLHSVCMTTKAETEDQGHFPAPGTVNLPKTRSCEPAKAVVKLIAEVCDLISCIHSTLVNKQDIDHAAGQFNGSKSQAAILLARHTKSVFRAGFPQCTVFPSALGLAASDSQRAS